MESPHIYVEVFLKPLSGLAEFNEGEPSFSIGKFAIEQRNEMRLVTYRT